MDWGRAKSILIGLLLVLNIMLAVSVVSRAIGGGADRTRYENVLRVLDGRGVTLLCELPGRVTTSGLLMYGDGARFIENCANALSSVDAASVVLLGRESLRYTNPHPAEVLDTSTLSALDEAVRGVLPGMGVDLSGFVTDYTAPDGDGGYLLRYILEYEGRPVFDSCVDVSVDRTGGISELAVSYRSIKSAVPDKRMQIIPAYQVVLKNYNSGCVIASVDLGFMGQNASPENPFIESEEGAVWRVMLDDGSERFFEAAYGDEIYPYVY